MSKLFQILLSYLLALSGIGLNLSGNTLIDFRDFDFAANTGTIEIEEIDSASLTKETGKQVYKIKIGEDKDEVIIGDEENPSQFKPEITFTKWNKENSLTLKPTGQLAIDSADLEAPTLTNGKIEVRNKTGKIGFYANPNGTDNLKFGIDFYEKPISNKVIYQIEDWENVKNEFDFFYQPPYPNTESDGSTWKAETHGKSIRPSNVNGSWAVYHKTKKDYVIGRTNYGCGKAYHDYRVKYTDSNGWWVWCDLFYDLDKGQRVVTIPEDFWNNATYPIKANDTLGTSGIGASQTQFSFVGWQYTTITGGICSVIKAAVWKNDGGTLYLGIYNDSSDSPTTLVANSDPGNLTITQLTKPTQDSHFTSGSITASLVASTKYWLVGDNNNYDILLAFDSGTKKRTANPDAPCPPMPANFSPNHDYDNETGGFPSIYATYTPSGGGAATSTPSVQIKGGVNIKGGVRIK